VSPPEFSLAFCSQNRVYIFRVLHLRLGGYIGEKEAHQASATSRSCAGQRQLQRRGPACRLSRNGHGMELHAQTPHYYGASKDARRPAKGSCRSAWGNPRWTGGVPDMRDIDAHHIDTQCCPHLQREGAPEDDVVAVLRSAPAEFTA
jgi:hypothetical protein